MSSTFDFANAVADPIELWLTRLLARKNLTTTDAALGLLLGFRISCCCANPMPMTNGELSRLARQVGLTIHRNDHWNRLRHALLRLRAEGFVVLHLSADRNSLVAIEVILTGGR